VLFDDLVQRMRIKQQLAIKYSHLARSARSRPRRKVLNGKSHRYRRQAITSATRLNLETFARTIDRLLLPRIKTCVVQIVREYYHAKESGGTGILFEINSARLLVTAAHAIDGALNEGIAMYVRRFQSKQLVQITGNVAFERTLDIAAMRLSDDVSAALDGYTFLRPEDADASRGVAPSGLYYLYGYPKIATYANVVEAKSHAAGLPMIARLVDGNPRFPRGSAEYVWLNAFANRYDLVGISGCGVWRSLRDGDRAAAWEPDQAKILAVETGTYCNHTLIGGTRIRHVFRLIAAHWPDLAPALISQLR